MTPFFRKNRSPLASLRRKLYNLEENLSRVRRICFSCGHFGQTDVSFEDDGRVCISCDRCGENIKVLRYPRDFVRKD